MVNPTDSAPTGGCLHLVVVLSDVWDLVHPQEHRIAGTLLAIRFASCREREPGLITTDPILPKTQVQDRVGLGDSRTMRFFSLSSEVLFETLDWCPLALRAELGRLGSLGGGMRLAPA